MKILVRNSDNVVIYAQPDLLLDTALRGAGWVDRSFNSANSRLDTATPPENFIGGVWSYINGVWAVADAAAHAQHLAQLNAAAAANLATAKAAKNAQINAWRAQANQTHFTHLGKQIACDALSRSDIDAVAGSVSLSGAFPVGFPGAWKAMDNTFLLLPDVAAFKALYASMTQQGTINFGQSQSLKATLAAATTHAQVNAILWMS